MEVGEGRGRGGDGGEGVGERDREGETGGGGGGGGGRAAVVAGRRRTRTRGCCFGRGSCRCRRSFAGWRRQPVRGSSRARRRHRRRCPGSQRGHLRRSRGGGRGSSGRSRSSGSPPAERVGQRLAAEVGHDEDVARRPLPRPSLLLLRRDAGHAVPGVPHASQRQQVRVAPRGSHRRDLGRGVRQGAPVKVAAAAARVAADASPSGPDVLEGDEGLRGVSSGLSGAVYRGEAPGADDVLDAEGQGPRRAGGGRRGIVDVAVVGVEGGVAAARDDNRPPRERGVGIEGPLLLQLPVSSSTSRAASGDVYACVRGGAARRGDEALHRWKRKERRSTSDGGASAFEKRCYSEGRLFFLALSGNFVFFFFALFFILISPRPAARQRARPLCSEFQRSLDSLSPSLLSLSPSFVFPLSRALSLPLSLSPSLPLSLSRNE